MPAVMNGCFGEFGKPFVHLSPSLHIAATLCCLIFRTPIQIFFSPRSSRGEILLVVHHKLSKCTAVNLCITPTGDILKKGPPLICLQRVFSSILKSYRKQIYITGRCLFFNFCSSRNNSNVPLQLVV